MKNESGEREIHKLSQEEIEENLRELKRRAASYHEHNNELERKLGHAVQASTLADLEIIVRETCHMVQRTIRRIERLEERMGIRNELTPQETEEAGFLPALKR